MKGKICLVTGATSGIGYITARELAHRGATVILCARNPEKARLKTDEIIQATSNPNVEFCIADLSIQSQVRKLAQDIHTRFQHLDVLVNNAGAFFLRHKLSQDGIEITFALNHLSYFLLTNLLLPIIKGSAPSRIVNVSSNGHYRANLEIKNLEELNSYRAMQAYANSKLANILFTYELARRLEGTQITVNALHPGFTKTNIGKNNGFLVKLLYPLIFRKGINAAKGAETSIYLACSEEVTGISGKYFVKKKPVKSSKVSYNLITAQSLWKISEELTGFNS
ncbi:MAG: SDR family oxidoreductase [Chloroflexi bacterium]|nr:SDR family oxidoreductase [Chloroflexota bacterium]